MKKTLSPDDKKKTRSVSSITGSQTQNSVEAGLKNAPPMLTVPTRAFISSRNANFLQPNLEGQLSTPTNQVLTMTRPKTDSNISMCPMSITTASQSGNNSDVWSKSTQLSSYSRGPADLKGLESERTRELSKDISKLLNIPSSLHSSPDKEYLMAGNTRSDSKPGGAIAACCDSETESRDSLKDNSSLDGKILSKPGVPQATNYLDGLNPTQPLNLYKVPDGIMQVFIIGLQPAQPISRPYIVIRLGDQLFQTSVAKTNDEDGNTAWNEGFELIISYHMQIFGTIHLDVYSNNLLLPDTHIGRAEVKISLLNGLPEIFTSYFEIWEKRLSASTVPEQRQRQILSKNLGALQVRINYRYQKFEDPEPSVAKVRGPHLIGTTPDQRLNKQNAQNTDDPTILPIETLVADFANEYNQYMDIVKREGKITITQTETTDGEYGTGNERIAGFNRVDNNSQAADADIPNAANDTSKDVSSFKWLSDIISPSGSSTPQKSTAAASKGNPTSITTYDSSSTVHMPSHSGGNSSQESADKHKTINEKTLAQTISEIFISQSTYKAIKSLERLVTAFNQGIELSSTELLGGLLTLYRFYNEADLPGISKPYSGAIINNVQDLKVPGHYARFALASYGWRALYFFNRGITLMDGAKGNSDVTSVLQYLNIMQEDLLGYEFRSSEVFRPSYFVVHDRPYDSVVLVIRGTMSAEDTVVDLTCEYSKWNGGLVHSGMKASAHWLFAKVMPEVFAFSKSQGIKKICVVGHSLGGSTAAILVIMILALEEKLNGLGISINEYDIKAYCFGPAPCISDNLAQKYRDNIETFVNKDDLIPRLSFGSASDFKRMSVCASDEADNFTQHLYSPFEDTNAQKQRWHEKFDRLKQVREEIFTSDDNVHLALPGNIHHIVAYRGESSSVMDSSTAKGKKAGKDPDRDILMGRRTLFGIDIYGDPVEGIDSGTQSPGPSTIPTPETKVDTDSVDPEELAEAVNTSIRSLQVSASDSDNTMTDAQKTEPAADVGIPPPPLLARSSTFYPVWVQRVPPEAFREIVLRPTMINDHMPSAYESAFARAIETQFRERRLRRK